MAKTKHYQHFCPVARSLEVIGEKWSLLIVRDLLGGDKRFTDLMRGLSNITPKWLTMRLRELEDAGIVERAHEPGKREVWYRLSPTGRELGGVIAELNVWGLRHAMRPPQEDEVVGDGRFGRSLLGFLNHERVVLDEPGTWRIDFSATNTGWFSFDGERWSRSASDAPDVWVRTTPREWATAIGQTSEERRATLESMDISGEPGAVSEFIDVICAIPANTRKVRVTAREEDAVAVV